MYNKMQRYTVYFIWKLLYMFRVVWYILKYVCYILPQLRSACWLIVYIINNTLKWLVGVYVTSSFSNPVRKSWIKVLLKSATFIIIVVNSSTCRSQWPRGLRHRSAVARLLRLWFRIPPGAWIFVCCECCQVEVSATNWSRVQRSPTDCGPSLCVI
jgi:hypothetical protein